MKTLHKIRNQKTALSSNNKEFYKKDNLHCGYLKLSYI